MTDAPDEPRDDEEVPDVEMPDEMEKQVDATEEAAAEEAAAMDETETSPDRRVIDPEMAQETDISSSVVFGILADERERYTLYYLDAHDGQGRLEQIAEQVAAWQNRTTVELATNEMQNRVRAGLYHADLPKLADYGLVDYDEESGHVTLTELGDQLSPYLEFSKQTEGNAYLDVENGEDARGSR